jgi:DnaJ family protein A protein 2
MVDPYKILEIPRDSTESDIKKAYLRLCLIHHPDKGGDAEKFHLITSSYEKLTDPSFENYSEKFDVSQGFKLFENMFDTVFPDNETDVKSIYKEISVTLQELYNGHSFDLTYKKQAPNPRFPVKICHTCNGNKFISIMKQINTYLNSKEVEKCTTCDGVGFEGEIVTTEHTLCIKIPPGTENDKKLVMQGRGNQTLTGNSGDLIVQLITENDKNFVRKGNDLYKNVSITLKESLLGLNYELHDLNDKINHIRLEGVLKPSSIKEIKELGMPIKNKEKFGNMYLKFKVKFPKKLNKKQFKFVEENF